MAEGEGGGGYGESGSKQIRLPKMNINNEYFNSILKVEDKMDFVLANLTRVDDPRPKIMSRQIINKILDDNTRYKFLDAFDEKMKEIDNMKGEDGKPANTDVQCEERIRVSQDFVGEVNGYLDEALALHKGQEIGEV